MHHAMNHDCLTHVCRRSLQQIRLGIDGASIVNDVTPVDFFGYEVLPVDLMFQYNLYDFWNIDPKRRVCKLSGQEHQQKHRLTHICSGAWMMDA